MLSSARQQRKDRRPASVSSLGIVWEKPFRHEKSPIYPLPIGWGLDGGSQRIDRATNALDYLHKIELDALTGC